MGHASQSPLRIVIVGGGTAGWMAASLMAKRWADRDLQISVIESADVGIIGVGEGSTPQLRAFFDILGVSEGEWMPRCNATYKTAIESVGWSTRPGYERYYHPFKTDLDDRSAPAYYFHTLLRRHDADVPAHPDRYLLNTRLAQQGRGPHPVHQFPFRSFYGYHFDATLIGRFLREWSTARGVRHLIATVAQINLTESGNIRSLSCSDGQEIEADFFVDSTGFRSLLLQQALGVRFVPFASNLYNDAAVAVPTEHAQPDFAPQTTATALRCGWAWRIPLTNRIGNGYVYSSRYLSADQAESELREHLGLGDQEVPLRHLRMKVGRVAQPWAANCLAVGLSQGFIEPLEATALHLVQETVERFIEAWDGGRLGTTQREAFNREINGRFEGVRDYIVCRYRMNTRSDSDYWRDAGSHDELSDSLRSLLQCWYAGEDIIAEIERQGIGQYFGVLSWHCLLGGYGIYPDEAQKRPPAARENRFDVNKIEDFVDRCALNFPSHAAQLEALKQPDT